MAEITNTVPLLLSFMVSLAPVVAGALGALWYYRRVQAQTRVDIRKAEATIRKAEEEGQTGRATVQPELIRAFAALPAEFAAASGALMRVIAEQQAELEKVQRQVASLELLRWENAELKQESKDIKQENAVIKQENAEIKEENINLKARVRELESRVAHLEAELAKTQGRRE